MTDGSIHSRTLCPGVDASDGKVFIEKPAIYFHVVIRDCPDEIIDDTVNLLSLL